MYEAEKVVDCRTCNGNKEYQIKWKGYDSSENTWEPEGHLLTATHLLAQFHSSGTHIKCGERQVVDNHRHFASSDCFSNNGDSESITTNRRAKRVSPRPPQKKPIRILAMSENKNHLLVYKVKLELEQKWVQKGFFIPEYLLELCEFYESNLNFRV